MSFEQQKKEDFEENSKKKKLEQERNEFFWEKKELMRQTHSLTQKLAQEIAEEFGIDIEHARKLLSIKETEITSNILDLKGEVNSEKLHSKIESAKKQIEFLSNTELHELKSQLEESGFRPETYRYHLSQLIVSESMQHRIRDPKNIGDNLIGAGIGIVDSSEAIALFLYGLGKGILLTPYHLYLLLTGKARW